MFESGGHDRFGGVHRRAQRVELCERLHIVVGTRQGTDQRGMGARFMLVDLQNGAARLDCARVISSRRIA
ncbi:MAG: hypothetical protein JRE73_15845 [Deltaproteobacteria bacterium]|nr:hypothetical protein [Deltaproteobacteria bacterium]